MKETIAWLISIEQKARELYSAAAKHFEWNAGLSEFLAGLAEDEAEHVRFMERAAEIIRSNEEAIRSDIIFDGTTRSAIEAPFLRCSNMLSKGNITADDMLDAVVNIEFSELNEIFLYVISSLKAENIEFQRAASDLLKHKEKIERYVQFLPEGDKYLSRIKQLPEVWEKNILVVDDDPLSLKLLAAVLGREGVVHTAGNGQDALAGINERYFDAIITDVHMPVMNGIEFYTQAVDKYPDIGKRFLFFSGAIDDHIKFFVQNDLAYLIKPSPVNEILVKVKSILNRSSNN